MLPIDVATTETLTFFQSVLTLRGAHVLEVGCGRGHLARAIGAKGANIVAIDASDEAVASTKGKGVEAVHVDFVDYEPDCTFDAIAFTRSLHHIQPLSVALQRARALLKPGGVILLEDFAAETMNESTLCWLRAQDAGLGAQVRLLSEQTEHRFPAASLEVWQKHHFIDHNVTSSIEMLDALKETFHDVKATSAPYLYRYLMDRLQDTDAAGDALLGVLERERQAIAHGKILAIGWRVVAR